MASCVPRRCIDGRNRLLVAIVTARTLAFGGCAGGGRAGTTLDRHICGSNGQVRTECCQINGSKVENWREDG